MSKNGEIQPRKKPLGIWVLSILNVILGSLAMLAAIDMSNGDLFGVGLFAAVVGGGLFRLEPWARWAAIIGYILNVLICFGEGYYVGSFIAVIIVIYLSFSEEVKNAFSK